ncbi:MAG: hypothetical protein AAF320_00935 [Myxococcota bacterium]
MESCQLDSDFDLTAFCQTRASAADFNGHTVCTSVAEVPAQCKLKGGFCELYFSANVNGFKCTDAGVSSNPPEKHSVMCKKKAAPDYVGNNYKFDACEMANNDGCSQVYTNLAHKTQAACLAIQVVRDATAVANAVDAAPRAMNAGHEMAFLVGKQACDYTPGKPAHHTPNLEEFIKMCGALSQNKCGADNTKDMCKWVSSAP